jgi:hypothetical protein
MKEELVLFSGGVDSTVLLKYFLKDTNKLIRVAYNQLGYDNNAQARIKEQNIAAKAILKYLFKKYRSFEYTTMDINFSFIRGKYNYWLDDQWNCFLAGIICRKYNIDKVWLAHFGYNTNYRITVRKLPKAEWLHNGSLDKILQMGYTLGDGEIKNSELKVIFPYHLHGKEIDYLKTKREAFDYLEPDLQKLVRSCEGTESFCGKCWKCKMFIEHKMEPMNA